MCTAMSCYCYCYTLLSIAVAAAFVVAPKPLVYEYQDDYYGGLDDQLITTPSVPLPTSTTAENTGEETERHEFPWLVRIEVFFYGQRQSRFCDASLISDQWLLTAASCVTPGASLVMAYLGKHDINVSFEQEEIIQPSVAVFVHPKYDLGLSIYNYDFALVKLNSPIVNFTTPSSIRPIDLVNDRCQQDQLSGGIDTCSFALVAGWNSTVSTKLRKTMLPLQTFSWCQAAWWRYRGLLLSPAKMCAGGEPQSQDACLGDQGGPVMCQDQTTKNYFQIGVVSHGDISCRKYAEDTSPTIYNRLCPALPWLYTYVKIRRERTTTTAPLANLELRAAVPYPVFNIDPGQGCGSVPSVANGYIDDQGGVAVGAIRFVYCNRGYTLTGPNVVVCVSSGTWSLPGFCSRTIASPTIQTLAQQCAIPYVSNGYFLDPISLTLLPNNATINVGTSVRLACLNNYNVRGNEGFCCASDGTLHPAIGLCSAPTTTTTTTTTTTSTPQPPIRCGPVPRITNGYVDSGDSTVGAVRYLYCNLGYALNGGNTVTCTSALMWTTPGYCARLITCDSFPIISNGYVVSLDVLSPVPAGETRNISCNKGYRLEGSTIVTCTSTGTWTQPGNCVPEITSCGSIPRIPNGFVAQNDSATASAIGVTRVVYCNSGYHMNGADTIICMSTGSWTLPGTCLQIVCGISPIVSNGYVARNDSTTASVGSVRSVYCNSGYYLDGPNSTTCLSNATWSSPGNCIRIISCGPVPVISNGSIRDDPPLSTIGTVRNVTCNAGYYLDAPSNVITCLPIGSWSSPGNCIRINSCGPVPPINNGYVKDDLATTSSSLIGTVRNVVCNTGYSMDGVSNVTCLSTGYWSQPGNCRQIITCGPVPVVSNGNVTRGDSAAVSSPIGAIQSVVCNSGYILDGADTIACLTNGSWSQPGSCRRITCGSVPIVSNGLVQDDGAMPSVIGAFRAISCNSGYFLEGVRNITCLPTGSWSSPGTCRRIITCGPVPAISNGYAPNSDAAVIWKTVGTTQVIACNSGYALDGADTITCLTNGSWSQPGVCRRITLCGQIPVINNGYVKGDYFSSSAIGATRNIACNPGYVLQGPTTIACLPTGIWSQPGNCTQSKICGPPPPLVNGYIIGGNDSSLPVGAIRNASCNADFYMDGATSITCLASLTWSQPGICIRRTLNCASPPTISNGYVQNGDSLATVGTVRTIICNNGYSLNGSSTIRCLQTGYWSLPGTCVRVNACTSIPTISNGYVYEGPYSSSSSTAVGATRNVFCNSGYSISGTNTITCLPTGVWSQPGNCIKINTRGCGPLPRINYGYVVRNDSATAFLVGAVRTVACNSGYYLDGTFCIYCETSGTWSKPGVCRPIAIAPVTTTPAASPIYQQQTNFCNAAANGTYLQLEQMLRSGTVNVNWRDPVLQSDCGWQLINSTALHRATACNRSQDIVVLLINSGGDVNCREDLHGKLPLLLVAGNGNPELTWLLLNRGAFINSRDNLGSTPLIYAATAGHLDTVALLLDRGCDVNARTIGTSYTALLTAANNGHANVVYQLLDRGADINARDSLGRTALMLAAANGQTETVRVLLAHGATSQGCNGCGSS